MSKIVLSPSETGSGDFTIVAPSTSSDCSLSLPATNGRLISTGDNIIAQKAVPVFSVAMATGTTSVPSSSFVKVALTNKIYDNYNAFNTTLSRFVAPVAGYYYLNGLVRMNATTGYNGFAYIFKNSSTENGNPENIRGNELGVSANVTVQVLVSGVMYLNGVGDYVELYGHSNGTSPTFNSTFGTRVAGCFLEGYLLST